MQNPIHKSVFHAYLSNIQFNSACAVDSRSTVAVITKDDGIASLTNKAASRLNIHHWLQTAAVSNTLHMNPVCHLLN